MSSKKQHNYVCQECGLEHRKWQGQCNACYAWNSLKQFTVTHTKKTQTGYATEISEVTRLSDISAENSHRLSSGFSELDRVLGGGFIQGEVLLLSGNPGAGKSTLLMQIIAHFSQSHSTLYITGEESISQLAERAKRLNINTENIHVASETCVENIYELHQTYSPQFVVIDSIQVMHTSSTDSFAGSITQVRESAAALTKLAKTTQSIFVLIGHVNKEGNLAGPKVLEHMIDCYLIIENSADSRHRLIRSHKNRFGSIMELGVFAMTSQGLKEISNPSAIFLDQNTTGPGSVVTVLWEGSRALLIEIQGLVDTQQGSYPKRVGIGIDNQRLVMILAILNKHFDWSISNQDVFINAVGGIRINETSSDLSVLAVIYSSFYNIILPSQLIIFGEIGLSGEVRAIPNGQERLQSADKHGFKYAIIPWSNQNKQSAKMDSLTVFPVKTIQEALEALKNLQQSPSKST